MYVVHPALAMQALRLSPTLHPGAQPDDASPAAYAATARIRPTGHAAKAYPASPEASEPRPKKRAWLP